MIKKSYIVLSLYVTHFVADKYCNTDSITFVFEMSGGLPWLMTRSKLLCQI